MTSLPRHPHLADPLFLPHYIERAGTSTLDMIARWREVGLPEPTFEQRGDHFVTTLWRDPWTDAMLAGLQLNERQKRAVIIAKTTGKITGVPCAACACGNGLSGARRGLALVLQGGALVCPVAASAAPSVPVRWQRHRRSI